LFLYYRFLYYIIDTKYKTFYKLLDLMNYNIYHITVTYLNVSFITYLTVTFLLEKYANGFYNSKKKIEKQ